jgi:hypothetical protein
VHDEDSSGEDPAADEENSLPDQYLPPELDQDEEDYERSLEDALEPLSQPPSPSYKDYSQDESTPKKDYYDYSMSLRSEPRVCSLLDLDCPTHKVLTGPLTSQRDT